MSKYGHNQFRPSAVINSVAQAGAGAPTGFNAGPKLGGGNQQPALTRPGGTQESLKAFQSHQNYTDQPIGHQDKSTDKPVAQQSPFRPKFSSKLDNYDS